MSTSEPPEDQPPAGADTVEITVGVAGIRLDRCLADACDGLSRARIQSLIRAGAVSVAGRHILDPNHRVNEGDKIVLIVPPPEPARPVAENIALDVVHEDDDLIVIDKPAGMVVHPGAGVASGTLVNALLYHCASSLSGIGGVVRPGIVHRLDKETSGLLVAAKTDAAHQHLAAQFADHGRTGDLDRRYLAFVWGAPSRSKGTIDADLGRNPSNPLKMAVRSSGGRHAVTHYEVREVYGAPPDARSDALAALVECRLETGRTHQIRVHLPHIGHPLIGDAVYGAGMRTKANRLPESGRVLVEGLQRQALHAHILQFQHPSTGDVLRFQSELPSELADLRRILRETAQN